MKEKSKSSLTQLSNYCSILSFSQVLSYSGKVLLNALTPTTPDIDPTVSRRFKPNPLSKITLKNPKLKFLTLQPSKQSQNKPSQMQKQKQKKQNQNQNQKKPSWQDLNPFILSKIFAFLSSHDQLFGPPYVCHSWLSATLHTLFRNSILDLRLIDTLDEENQRVRFTHLLKLAINQYQGWVSIQFPSKHMLGYFATLYIAEKTPNISCVALSPEACVNMFPIFVSSLYWKKLRIFRAKLLGDVGFLVISQLVDYCKSITELGLHGSVLMERDVTCLVEGFSGLNILDLCESTLSCAALGIVLDGRLKCVKEINILHCKFVGDDGEDVREDYWEFKNFKEMVVEKASGLKRLKKFIHCLEEKPCLHCRNRSSSDSEDK